MNSPAPTASLPPKDAMTAAPVADGAAFSFDAVRFNAALQTYRGHHIDGAEDVVAASYVADGASGDISKWGNVNAARF